MKVVILMVTVGVIHRRITITMVDIKTMEEEVVVEGTKMSVRALFMAAKETTCSIHPQRMPKSISLLKIIVSPLTFFVHL
jgi:hypothetical protein